MDEQYIQKKVKGVADICFLLDATGSMQSCIDNLKTNIQVFINKLTTPDANGGTVLKDWRICIWGYRDFEYDPQNDAYDGISKANNHLVINPFTRDADEVRRQLEGLIAKGGGDEPESLLDALYVLVSQGNTAKGVAEDPGKWRYRSEAARCVIVFTDATFHPIMSELSGAPGGTVEDVRNLLQQEKIRLSLFTPENADHIEEDFSCYGELGATDKCVLETVSIPVGSTAVQAIRDLTANQNHFQRVLEQLGKTISQSGANDTEEL